MEKGTHMTLLQSYIDGSIRFYQEPERRGVEKGKEIGPFRGRFEAALYSMYEYDKKQIAERANISYAFMRKLWVDDNFIKLRETLMDQFVISFVLPYLMSGSVYKVGTSSSEGKVLIDCGEESAFADAVEYSVDLKKMICDLLVKRSKDHSICIMLESHDRFVYLLSVWNEPGLNKVIFLEELNQYTHIIEDILTEGQLTGNLNEDESHKINKVHSKMVEFSQFIKKLSRTI
jgi:hypothetical protein